VEPIMKIKKQRQETVTRIETFVEQLAAKLPKKPTVFFLSPTAP